MVEEGDIPQEGESVVLKWKMKSSRHVTYYVGACLTVHRSGIDYDHPNVCVKRQRTTL